MAAICGTCDDTHRMDKNGLVVPCTACPVPCGECREGMTAYCVQSCRCACHRDSEKPMSPVEALRDVLAWLAEHSLTVHDDPRYQRWVRACAK